MDEDSRESRWYVIHTYSGYEKKVVTNLEKIVENRKLEHLIQGTKIPFEIVIETTGEDQGKKKTKEVERKLFPSYVLVKMIMNDESWHVVRNVRGVTSFVGPGSKPVPLTDEEVSKFDIDTIFVTEVNFEIGDSVKIIDGALRDSIGVVEEISSDKKKAKLMISMFGRQMSTEIETSSVAPIKQQ
ncbi:MAG: transcription termination/antitermination protein NusG [Oscillospiraceae bacterium]|nr:transcription termination/antitermination protein NusG [Oscillospiraceae bacterium]